MAVHLPHPGERRLAATTFARRTACGMPAHAAPFYEVHDDPARVTCKRCARYKEPQQPQETRS